MSLAFPDRTSTLRSLAEDYVQYLSPFLRRIGLRAIVFPMTILKSIEFGIYRWYEPPLRREYRRLRTRELIFKLTSACTDRCPKCGIWKKPERVSERLPIDVLDKCVLDLGRELDSVSITGGEPLLLKENVLCLGTTCKSQGIPMTVVTNGVLADANFLKEYAGLGHILVISVDTIDPGRWKYCRGRDNHAVVFRNIEYARSALGQRLRIQSVLARETVDDVPEVADYCRRADIEHIVQPYMDFGGTWSGTEASTVRGAPCEAWRNICVYPNGDIVRCFDHLRIPQAKIPLGNIGVESIDEILQKTRTQEITELMRRCQLPCRQLSCNRSRESEWSM